MIRSWLLACACAAVAHSAAVTTDSTLVVTKTDEEGVFPTAPTQTTEEPPPPLKMMEMTVTADVTMRYARTAVVTRVRNTAARAQEATFRVLLPETAFISGFVMTLPGKSYKAYVKEKEEAKKEYNDAISQGVSAAHIATKARDSNHFTVSVNVEPQVECVFNLTYEELLVRRRGVYNLAVNLHPGRVVPALTVIVRLLESQKITELRVPEVRTGNEVDAGAEDAQNPIAKIERGPGDRIATIIFTPGVAEQQRLMNVYAEKSRESSRSQYHSLDQEDQSGVLGQFVVQYDVDRPKDGEVLVNDGYFVHFLAPDSLPPLNKHVVFVLDTSGSMTDRKIVQLRAAMISILGELNPGDYVNIVEFESNVQVHDLAEADAEPSPNHKYAYFDEHRKPPTLVPPFAATPENIEKAKIIISRLSAAGGTDIDRALKVALNLVQKGVHWTVNDTKIAPIEAGNGTTEVAVTTTEPELDETKPEPIIIFLTDGDPTVGETNPQKIISHMAEANYGKHRASVFTLAFGEDADRKFLRRLSLMNDGFMRHIYEAADAALQLRDFYRQVASPLLADVNFTYPEDQVQKDSLTKHNFRTYYAGSELVVAGRRSGATLLPTVGGWCGTDDVNKKKTHRWQPSPVAPSPADPLPLERLWAYLTVRQLLEERDRLDAPAQDQEPLSPGKQALKLALKYEFVTPLTSLVVVKPNATKAVDAESVDDPKASPFGFAQHSAAAYYPNPHSVGGIRRYGGMAGFFGHGFQHRLSAPLPRPLHRPSVSLKSPPGHPAPDFQHVISTPVYSTTTTPPPPLPELREYPWTAPLLDAGSLRLTVNGTELLLKLRSNTTVTDTGSDAVSDAGEPCARAVGGGDGGGQCLYLTRCAAAKTITLTEYQDTYCIYRDGYAGVCCPKEQATTTT